MVRQSFFHDDLRIFTNVGGGVTGCRGFHSSFRPTHGGLSMNIGIHHCCSFAVMACRSTIEFYLMLLTILCADVSATMILTPGPVIDFLVANQNAWEPRYIDWAKVQVPSFSFCFVLSIDIVIFFDL